MEKKEEKECEKEVGNKDKSEICITSNPTKNNNNKEKNIEEGDEDITNSAFTFDHDLTLEEAEIKLANQTMNKPQNVCVKFECESIQNNCEHIDNYCKLNHVLKTRRTINKCKLYDNCSKYIEYKMSNYIDKRIEDTEKQEEEKTEKKDKKGKTEKQQASKKDKEKKKSKNKLTESSEENVKEFSNVDPNIPLVEQYEERINKAYSLVEDRVVKIDSADKEIIKDSKVSKKSPKKNKSSSSSKIMTKTEAKSNGVSSQVVSRQALTIQPVISYCEQVTDAVVMRMIPHKEDIVLGKTCRSNTLWSLPSKEKCKVKYEMVKVLLDDCLTEGEQIDLIDSRLTSEEIKAVYELGNTVFPETDTSSIMSIKNSETEKKSDYDVKINNRKKSSSPTSKKTKKYNKLKEGKSEKEERNKVKPKSKDGKEEKNEETSLKAELIPDKKSVNLCRRIAFETETSTSNDEAIYLQRFLFEAVQR